MILARRLVTAGLLRSHPREWLDLDHGLTGTSRDRPGLRLALAASRDILDELQKARHSASSTDLSQVEPSQLRVKVNLPYSSMLDDADIGSGAHWTPAG